VAGIFSQSDRAQGVGRAPANFMFKGVIGLGVNVDALAQSELNPRGVNCLRKLEDGKVAVWGARTLSRDPLHLYVNSRRVLLATIKALIRNLLWAIFEPNDAFLPARIADSLKAHLQSLLARGLSGGTRPEDAYYVKCDAELNPRASRDQGFVVAEVGLALNRPAEFIVLTVKRKPEALTLVEEEV
jgi:phage tail sheath protein FI